VDDGTTSETHNFDGLDIVRHYGKNCRTRLAISFEGSASLVVETATLTNGSLKPAAWTQIGTATTALTQIDSPATGRTWLLDSGTNRLRIYEVRIVAADVEVTRIRGSLADPSSGTYVTHGDSWTLDSAATKHTYGDFENVTDDVRYNQGIQWSHGRSADQFVHRPSTLSTVFSNEARKYEPRYSSSALFPGVGTNVPVLLRASHSGTRYDLFSGFTEGWRPVYSASDPNNSVSQMAASDALRMFQRAKTGGKMESVVGDLDPIGYWTLAGSGTLTDDSTNSNDIDTETDVIKNWEPVLWGDALKMPRFNGSTSVLRDTAVDAATLQQTGDMSISFALRTETGGDYHIVSAYGSGGAFYGLELDCAPGQAPIVRWIRNDGAPTAAGSDISLDALDHGYFTDGRPHIVCVTFDQSANTAVVYVDGLEIATNTNAVPNENGTPTDSGTTEIRIGLEGTHGSGTSGFNGSLGHVALFNKVLTASEALTITRANISSFPSQTPTARIATLLDAYGWPQHLRSLDSASTTVTETTPLVTLVAEDSGVESISTSSDGTFQVEVPEGGGTGNLFLVAIAWPANKDVQPTDPVDQGFTLLLEVDQANSTDVDLRIWYRVLADGDESWTFHRNTAGLNSWWTGCFDGDDSTTPFTASDTDDGASSGSVTAPDITAAAGDYHLTFHANLNSGSTINNWTVDATMIELANLNSTRKSSSQRANMAVAALADLAAGATGTKTATASVAGEWASASVLVNAGGAAVGGTTTSGALAARDMSNSSFLDEMKVVVECELGELLVCTGGIVRFRGQDWRADNQAAVAATFGEGASELPYRALSLEDNEDQLTNQVTVIDADANEYTVLDTDSIQDHGLAAEEFTIQCTGTAAGKTWADEWIARYSEIRRLVRSLTVDPLVDPANLFPVLLGCDLSERWEISHTPPGAAADIEETFFVESVSGFCNADDRWEFSIDGSPTPDTPLVGPAFSSGFSSGFDIT
jgi:hypothetical protein